MIRTGSDVEPMGIIASSFSLPIGDVYTLVANQVYSGMLPIKMVRYTDQPYVLPTSISDDTPQLLPFMLWLHNLSNAAYVPRIRNATGDTTDNRAFFIQAITPLSQSNYSTYNINTNEVVDIYPKEHIERRGILLDAGEELRLSISSNAAGGDASTLWLIY